MEAFGNAKTTRNDYSTRCGKFTQIYINQNNNNNGAILKTYLLKKSFIFSIYIVFYIVFYIFNT